MQIVEFLNEFHVKTDFGRFADYQKNLIKSIHFVEEWKQDLFTGRILENKKNIDTIFLQDIEQSGKSFEYLNDGVCAIFRKYVSASRFDWNKKAYILPISCKKLVYEIGRKCRASLTKIEDTLPEQVDVIPELKSLDFEIELKEGSLRDYQKKGIARGLELERFINGDMPGLGKTLQSVATLYAAEKYQNKVSFPCLVICPSSLKINWKREFEKWTPKRTIILTYKNKANWHRYFEVGAADVFIVNYESLKKFFVKHMPAKKDLKHSSDIVMDDRINIFNSIIIDEIHKLKNENSQRTKITINITKGKNYIIGLTGTPVVNKPKDLYAQLAIIFQLVKFGGAKGFLNRYCEGGSGAANLKELNYLLNKNCFFRREKHEVLKDLPAKQRQTILCEISNRSEYDLIENDFKNFLKANNFTDKEIRKKLRSEVIVKIMMMLQKSALGKIEAAQEYIDEVIDSGQKIVVFCKHKAVVAELSRLYPQAVKVTGSETIEQKQASVDAFQNNPKTNIIIGSHTAAGVGLTLTSSSEVLFLELPWTFADLEQCEDRCHRIGQVSSVRATALLAEDTLDKWLYDLIMQKKAVADQITGADDVVPVTMLDNLLDAFKK